MRYPPSVIFLTATLLLVLFCSYYAVTAWHLPRGAGPDGEAHYDVARFILEKGRLAVLPDDVDSLLLTPYGSTRALRPPLSYLVSAGVAWLINDSEGNHFKELRFGSGLLCALATVLTFFSLMLLFERYWLALGGSLLFGLLPQLAFVASYTNDDSGAIFAGTALIFSMVLILRTGLNMATAIVFGLCVGLALIAKFTAWLLLPFAACFLIPYLWKSRLNAAKYISIVFIAIVVGGGWWIVFNIYHYGINDPFLTRVSQQLSEQHARIPAPGNRGYASQGIGVFQLILHNYKNFIGESFKATVGNLDWLRLRMGWPQYLLYAIVFTIGFLYLPVRLIGMKLFVRQQTNEIEGINYFYFILFLMVLFQIYMYVRFNIYHDVQIQGKYLLPVFLPILVLFSAAVATFAKLGDGRNQPTDTALKILMGTLAFVMIIGSHVHALQAYVIPYYFQQPRQFRASEPHYLDLTNLKFVETSVDLELSVVDDGILARSTSRDPQILLRSKYCKWLSANSIIHLVLDADTKGVIKIYIDQGSGFNEGSVIGREYMPGENQIIIPFGIHGCKAIRLDPTTQIGEVVIKRFSIISMHISDN
ncbi:MAG: hypothetical protein QNI91_03090 [Arenicellales bacterium]|nr:hypothetical protein [Arenicellales bacterium]